MQHCDPDVLSLVALGEGPGDSDSAHLEVCGRCRQDVAELEAVVAAVRVDIPAGPDVPPPPQVWDRIAAQTGVTARPGKELSGAELPEKQLPETQLPEKQVPEKQVPGTVVPIDVRRHGRRSRGRMPARLRVLGVAAAALVVGAATGSAVTAKVVGGDGSPAGPVVAQVQLAAFPAAADAGGRAAVVTASGSRDLVVDVSRLGTRPGTFFEVWLIDRSVKRMVPVGILHGSEGVFTIPDSVDLSRYPVVDISVQEPGDPRHSGNSVLRGTLEV